MTEQPTLLHFAAEAHRRKWAFAEYDSAAFSVLDCIGNEMRAAYDATQSAAETPDAESPALVPDGPGEASTATPEAVRKLAEDERAEWDRAMIAEARAEAAEAKLAAIEALCRDIGASVPESVRTPTVAVVRILAITDNRAPARQPGTGRIGKRLPLHRACGHRHQPGSCPFGVAPPADAKAVASRGAAKAREALGITRNDDAEAS